MVWQNNHERRRSASEVRLRATAVLVADNKRSQTIERLPGDCLLPNRKSAEDTTVVNSPTAAVLGEIGLPASLRELSSRRWDVIIVGAGHNGLACAAYLARSGKRVLVLESRARVGGACTIEEPFPGVPMSPCAYLADCSIPWSFQS